MTSFKEVRRGDERSWWLEIDVGVLAGDDLEVLRELQRRLNVVQGVMANHLDTTFRIEFYPDHFVPVGERARQER